MKFPLEPNDEIFSLRHVTEIVTLKADGRILIKGKELQNPQELVDTLKEFAKLSLEESKNEHA